MCRPNSTFRPSPITMSNIRMAELATAPPSSSSETIATTNAAIKQSKPLSSSLTCEEDNVETSHRLNLSSNHPIKIIWDCCTLFLSIFSAYNTHISILDRRFEKSGILVWVCEVWFILDIILNFIERYQRCCKKERKASSIISRKSSSWIFTSYLVYTWLAIDIISCLPWELFFVKPVVEMNRRRHIVKKIAIKSRDFFGFVRHLRKKHIRWFQTVTKHTKSCAGINEIKLIQTVLKYLPRYGLFFKEMRMILAIRLVKQVDLCQKVLRNLFAAVRRC